jgi:hypothetical protein
VVASTDGVCGLVDQELVDQISQPLPDMAVFRFLQDVQRLAPYLVSPLGRLGMGMGASVVAVGRPNRNRLGLKRVVPRVKVRDPHEEP